MQIKPKQHLKTKKDISCAIEKLQAQIKHKT